MNNEDDHEQSPGTGGRPVLWNYAGMGFELAASIVGLTLVGLWVDHQFKITPTGVLIGAGIGVVGGLYNFIRTALKLGRAAQDLRVPPQDREDDDGHG